MGILFLVISHNAFAQTFKYAVTATTSVFTPSVYLRDYVSPGSNKLSVSIVLNDLHEPSWNIYLRLTLESSNVKLETKSEYIPDQPITIFPGVPLRLSGDMLSEYFDYNHLNVAGITKEELIKDGGLPEGFYNFCFEVYDYNSRRKISNTSCFGVNIVLNDPPVILLPQNESIIKPLASQNINFQWQVSNVDPMQTEYVLSVYELTDHNAEPLSAITNGKAQQIFQSDPTRQCTYNYNIASPLLEKGKKYIFIVKAQNTEGKDIFRNNGVSQISCFYYGYPENGNIVINTPKDKEAFAIKQNKYFEWFSPDNLTNNQPVSYHVKMVKKEGAENTQAILGNSWFEYSTSPSVTKNGSNLVLTEPLDKLQEYAWQVTASSGDQQIAKSPVYTFFGPPFIEEFYAGNHLVKVSKTQNSDLSYLSGTGKVRLSKDGDWIDVEFENISIKEVSGIYVLEAGMLKRKLNAFSPLELKPFISENGNAYFLADSFQLNENGLFLKGRVEWQLPFPTRLKEPAKVVSVSTWFDYNPYLLSGKVNLTDSNDYELIDPVNFRLQLSNYSDFFIVENKFKERFHGNIWLPENMNGSVNKRVPIPFSNEEQLYYFTIDNTSLVNQIPLVPNTKIFLAPTKVIIDLSEQESPLKFANNPEWKGVYFEKFNIVYETNIDRYQQLFFDKSITQSFILERSNQFKSWAISDGLHLLIDTTFRQDDAARFNQFPSKLKNIKLEIQSCIVSDGHLKGTIKIPVISETEDYAYTVPISNDGFQTGYLDQTLDGLNFIFNENGGEQKLNISIKRAVFADKERLDMTLDVEWPAIGAKFESVNGFKAWGNYQIGFYVPNGIAQLDKKVAGEIQQYPMTVDMIGCGSQQGLYAFGTSASMLLGADVSGSDGPPIVNLYSVAENKLLGKYIATSKTKDGSSGISAVSDGNGWTSGTATINVNHAQNSAFDADQLKNQLDSIKLSKEDVVKEGEEILQRLRNVSIAESISADTHLPAITEPTVTSNTSHFDFTAEYSPEALMDALEQLAEFLPDSVKQNLDINAFKELIRDMREDDKINIFQNLSNVGNLVMKLINDRINEIIRTYTDKISAQVDTINARIVNNVHGYTNVCTNAIDNGIKEVVNNVADNIAESLENEDAKKVLYAIAEDVSTSLRQSLTRRIDNLIESQIIQPVTNNITSKFRDILIGFIQEELSKMGNEILTKGVNANINIDFNRLFTEVGQKVFVENFHQDTIIARLDRMKNAVLDSLNPVAIFDELSAKLLTDGAMAVGQAIKDAAVDFVKDQVTNALGEAAGDVGANITGQVFDNIGNNIKMDFSDIGGKIQRGEWNKIIAFDPCYIVVKTNILDFEGEAHYYPNDSVYGAVWKGMMNVNIKVPVAFQMNAVYINGRKDDLSYWFCQIGAGSIDLKDKTISKKPKKLEEIVKIGPVGLAGAAGRLYHHMSETDNGDNILPDASMDYGLFMNLVLFDYDQKGQTFRIEAAAEFKLKTDGNFEIDLNGNMQVFNQTIPKDLEPIKTAVGKGEVRIYYNSAEKHFLGMGSLEINNPGSLCAQVFIEVDLKPSYWKCSLGTEEKKVFFQPGCMYFTPTGWLIVDSNTANLGLGIRFSATAQSPYIYFFGTGYAAYAEFGFAAGINVVIQYAPRFALNEAGLWAEAWAGVGIKTSKGAKWEVLTATLKGRLRVKFNPPPTVASGSLAVTLKILCFKVGFDMGFEHKFS